VIHRIALLLAAVTVSYAQLTTIASKDFLQSPPDWSYWAGNGSLTQGSAGLTSSSNGSLMYTLAMPANYEVRTRYRFAANGGSYFTYFRASNDANAPANTGTFYAVELQNPQLDNGQCNVTLKIIKRELGIGQSDLHTFPLWCNWLGQSGDLELAFAIRSNSLMIYRRDLDTALYAVALPAEHATASMPRFQAGVGVLNGAAGNGITSVTILNPDTVAPPAPPVPTVSTTGTKVEMQWMNTTDAHTGIAYYNIYRIDPPNSTLSHRAGVTKTGPYFVDRLVTPNTTYTYILVATDYHFNSSETYFAVNVPGSGAFDPRQIGLRPTGVYWGAGQEQIDMQSGNLNYTVPILTAKWRTGPGLSLALNYNSQMWRKDNATNSIWYYGRDVGYGHGWKLLAGSITPVYSNWYEIAYYLYIDSTGAEYRLTENSGNVWTSKEGTFVSYDAGSQKLYFTDGSFWEMKMESGLTEPDAGTRYPTLAQDTNGNRIEIKYLCAPNTVCYVSGTSSRISTIRDITTSKLSAQSYTFSYTNGRLTGITHTPNVGVTNSKWVFTYGTGTANTPWTPAQNPQNFVQELRTAKHWESGGEQAFAYYPTGEINHITLPYGGRLRYGYADWTSASQRVVREVNARLLRKQAAEGSGETTHYFGYDGGDAAREYHVVRVIWDDSLQYDKVWWFDDQRRLVTFDERKIDAAAPGQRSVTVRKSFTWSVPMQGNSVPFSYIQQVDTTIEPWRGGGISRRSKQSMDVYGNVTRAEEYDYGNSESTRKVYTSTYVSDPNYTSRFIRNRPLEVTVKIGDSGAPTVVRTWQYDLSGQSGTHPCGSIPSGGSTAIDPNTVYLHDSSYVSATYRANVTSGSGSGCVWYDYLGVARAGSGPSGTVTMTPDPLRGHTVPSTITASGYTSTLNWNDLLQLGSVTGPNSATSIFGYDAAGNLASSKDPDGGEVTSNHSVTGRFSSVSRGNGETYTTLDGLGRPTQTKVRYSQNNQEVIESITDTEYEPCACSPIGKMKRVSMPYKNLANRVWTTYTYDELGRVKSVTLPPNTGTAGSSGQTTYEYVLNTVKVTDPAGRWKKYTMDGFGNLTQVEEPKPSPMTGSYLTTHTYTVFNELATVTMTRDGFNGSAGTTVTQTRSFEYSGPPGLRMLWQTTFPENGVTQYGYQGKLLMSKKNRNGVWMYSYNAAQQLEEVKKYPGATVLWSPNTPEDTNRRINYYYGSHPFQTDFAAQNTAGRLVAIAYKVRYTMSNVPTCCWQDVREFYSYTTGGRLKKKRLDVGTAKMDVAFEYDVKGKLEFMVYPSGKRVKYTYDDLARHTGLKEILANNTEDQLVNNLTYGDAGQLLSMNWKVAGSNIMAGQSWQYNNRLQMSNYQFSGPGSLGSVSHEYKYSATNNDGKLWRRKDHVSGEEVEYTYDSLHRLATGSVLAGTVTTDKLWGQQYVYDGFGNMKQKIGHAAAQWTGFDIPMNSATNNGSGGAAGGDMDGWQIVSNGGTNGYAPDNKRIWNVDKWYLWVGSMRVGMYTVAGSTVTAVREDWYVAGRRVEPSDRLGSNLSGGLRLLPYGEELQPPAVAHGRTKFATYERDAATGGDYADQRWYTPGFGRFTTEDPYLASGGAGSPSSWNRFAYVEGDPVNWFDPDGLARRTVNLLPQIPRPPSSPPPPGGGGGPKGDDKGDQPRPDPDAPLEGGGEPLTPEQYLRTTVLNALSRPSCANMFGTEATRANGWNPVTVADALLRTGTYSNGLNTINMREGYLPSAYAGLTLPFMGLGGTSGPLVGMTISMGANITINTNLPAGSTFVDVASTVLHEIGHAYDYIPQSGGSSIRYDGLLAPSINQTLNEIDIRKNCL
jgi:RHS repeat-associated protein